MRYPIDNWEKLPRGFLFKQIYPKSFGVLAGHPHLGLDVIAPLGTPIYAWQDLTVVQFMVGAQGGNTIFVKCPNNPRLFRLMHLQKSVKVGNYKEGQILCYMGSTGSASSGSHLHCDITSKGVLNIYDITKFEDPENFFKMINKK